jgi:hypothetical protein
MSALASVAFTLLWGAASAEATDSWEKTASEQGIEVSQRPVPGRGLPEMRAVGDVDANLYEILAVIRDVERQPEWMYECKEARVLRTESETVSIVYNRTDAPWPVADRYAVVHSEIVVVRPGNEVEVRFRSSAEALPDPPRGTVRMARLVGAYTLRALGPDRTRVDYRVDADPGGLLPVWLVRSTSRDLPLETLLSLREQVARTRGSYEAFLDEWDPDRRGGKGGSPAP